MARRCYFVAGGGTRLTVGGRQRRGSSAGGGTPVEGLAGDSMARGTEAVVMERSCGKKMGPKGGAQFLYTGRRSSGAQRAPCARGASDDGRRNHGAAARSDATRLQCSIGETGQ
jgi:hypothetical protein